MTHSKFLIFLCLLSACSSVKDSPKYQLSNGSYKHRQGKETYKKVFVVVKSDTLKIFPVTDPTSAYIPTHEIDQFFLKRSLDFDVMTIPFKFRPVTNGLPRQLTTDFNGNIFIGYRIDRFRLRAQKTPAGTIVVHRHRGLSAGAFGGIGSTSVTPSTTSGQTADEYSGLILSRGLAIMVGINNLTVGLGVGWDYLTDRDRNIWIYQNRPWYGLTLGLNLN